MEKAVNYKKNSRMSTKALTRISFLAVIGLVLELLNFAIPIFPGFLKLDLSSLPSVIAGFIIGPYAVIFTEVVKNILKIIIRTETVGIGELSNLICGIALSLPIAYIYKKMPNIKGCIIGSIVGVISLTIVASLSNYFLILPAYSLALGGLDAIIEMCKIANSNITDIKGIIVFAIVPFNILKGTITAFAGCVLYRFLLPIIKR